MTNSWGACKVATFYCHYCACRSDAISLFRYVEGGDRCKLCKHNEHDRCSHEPVNTSDKIKLKALELLDLLEDDARARIPNFTHLSEVQPRGPSYGIRYDGVSRVWEPVLLRTAYNADGSPSYNADDSAYNADGSPSRAHLYDYGRYVTPHSEEEPELLAKSRIKFDRNALDKADNPNNIEYAVLPHKPEDNNTFNKNVLHDLKLCLSSSQIPTDKGERIAKIRKCLLLRERVHRLRDALEEYDRAIEHRLMDPGKCLPCVLHFHCRAVEKIVQQLLLCGMRQNLGSALPSFVARVEEVVNRDMLERKSWEHDPAWRFPLSDDKKQLGDVKLSNNQAREFVKGFPYLVEVCTVGYDDIMQSTWMDACVRFRKVAEMIDSKYEFEFEDVAHFQLAVDEFCDAYFTVTGRDGMTNYFHLLRAGHFSWFLEKYGNLYRYSQQGWENVNSRFKRKFFQNSQRGGGRGGSSKLLPVFYTFLREMLWRNGYLGGLFEHLGVDGKVNIDYGKVQKMPNNKRVSKEDIEVYGNTLFKFAPREELNQLIGAVEGGLGTLHEEVEEGSAD